MTDSNRMDEIEKRLFELEKEVSWLRYELEKNTNEYLDYQLNQEKFY